jgi:hypothetical protein
VKSWRVTIEATFYEHAGIMHGSSVRELKCARKCRYKPQCKPRRATDPNLRTSQPSPIAPALLAVHDHGAFTRSMAFAENPKACLAGAFEATGNEEQTRTEYESQLLPLVYGTTRPDFAEAFSVFRRAASALVDTL